MIHLSSPVVANLRKSKFLGPGLQNNGVSRRELSGTRLRSSLSCPCRVSLVLPTNNNSQLSCSSFDAKLLPLSLYFVLEIYDIRAHLVRGLYVTKLLLRCIWSPYLIQGVWRLESMKQQTLVISPILMCTLNLLGSTFLLTMPRFLETQILILHYV